MRLLGARSAYRVREVLDSAHGRLASTPPPEQQRPLARGGGVRVNNKGTTSGVAGAGLDREARHRHWCRTHRPHQLCKGHLAEGTPSRAHVCARTHPRTHRHAHAHAHVAVLPLTHGPPAAFHTHTRARARACSRARASALVQWSLCRRCCRTSACKSHSKQRRHTTSGEHATATATARRSSLSAAAFATRMYGYASGGCRGTVRVYRPSPALPSAQCVYGARLEPVSPQCQCCGRYW